MSSSPPSAGSVEFEVVMETWSSIRLLDQDGLMLEVKPVVYEIIRTDAKDARGNPVYVIKAALATRIVASKEAG